jgi:hypothetical protein
MDNAPIGQGIRSYDGVHRRAVAPGDAKEVLAWLDHVSDGSLRWTMGWRRSANRCCPEQYHYDQTGDEPQAQPFHRFLSLPRVWKVGASLGSGTSLGLHGFSWLFLE